MMTLISLVTFAQKKVEILKEEAEIFLTLAQEGTPSERIKMIEKSEERRSTAYEIQKSLRALDFLAEEYEKNIVDMRLKRQSAFSFEEVKNIFIKSLRPKYWCLNEIGIMATLGNVLAEDFLCEVLCSEDEELKKIAYAFLKFKLFNSSEKIKKMLFEIEKKMGDIFLADMYIMHVKSLESD